MERNFDNRKGQSAIEYLTTYGWMLLVIAIVGGAIFTTVQDSANVSQASGFSGEDVQISNFGINSDGNLAMSVRSAASDPVTIEKIEMVGLNSSSANESAKVDIKPNEVISVGNRKSFTMTQMDDTDQTYEYQTTITYSTEELSNLTVSGTLTGQMVIK